jgi:aspartate/methionine/tyrosine aminotransferase
MLPPLPTALLQQVLHDLSISDLSQATIREIVAIASRLERETGLEFIHMEMGIPGLPPATPGLEAEITALQQGIAATYPPIDGLPELKHEASRFIKAFTDIDIAPEACIPVVGSMQGTFASFLIAGQCDPRRDTILFLDPGFPVQKQQATVLGLRHKSFDVYDFRGPRLEKKLASLLSPGNICCLIYSNPNNPAWFCLDESELQTIGRLATQHDVIVLEDLAYFAMDFRRPTPIPFRPPYQPSVGKHTDNYLLLISGSKIFSYAGQRIGIAALSDSLYRRPYPGLTERYATTTFGTAFVHRALYALSSGTAHSAQYALAALFKSAADGRFPFLEPVKEYARRARRLKTIFLRHGFEIVYDSDGNEPLADGFYFTLGRPNLSGGELMAALLALGVSTLSLSTTGSRRQGVRICTSSIKDHHYDLLDARLAGFTAIVPPARP